MDETKKTCDNPGRVKGKRELKAITKDNQCSKRRDQTSSSSSKSRSPPRQEKADLDDRELKKIRMIEEMFQKKEAEEERKRKLKEKRNLRKQLLET